MKVAVIGCGTIANSAHIPSYMNNPEAEDRDRIAVAKDFLDRAGFKPTDEVKVSGELNNPFEGLTTEELKKLVSDG